MEKKSTIGLYIHIPFCAAKCDYCDFLSFANAEDKWDSYCKALVNELSNYTSQDAIDSIFIGGGTPTVWSTNHLDNLLQALPQTVPGAEITCEANPGTLNEEKIAVLFARGVNRISLGLQAWQPHLLKAIGRKDSFFIESFKALRQAGFININVDLMFALPEQTMADWKETLDQLIALQPEHISAYGLTLEENTPLYSRFDDFDESLDRQMYHYCKGFLQEHGYAQYELSNFCKPGFESIHNLRYWKRKPYIGFGLGAHSFDNSKRWHNTTDIEEYLSGDYIKQDIVTITDEDALAESIFLGLRMSKGVKLNDEINKAQAHRAWIEKMKADGLLIEENSHIFLSDRGMDLANIVMAGFVQ